MAGQSDAVSGIWIPQLSQDFYRNVIALSARLGGSESPRAPQNYRQSHYPRSNELYVLRYEEELHLADHFAFLAHAEEGVGYVSAATIEETRNPPSFTVRLASNETPEQYVLEGISRILGVVQAHAKEGRHRELYRSRLFNEVVSLNRNRIYGRMRSSQWKRPRHFRGKDIPQLYSRIEQNIRQANGKLQDAIKRSGLDLALKELRTTLQAVDSAGPAEQQELLQKVIRESYHVSKLRDFKSLESHLRELGASERVAQSREVLEIDKLGKYLELCNDLIRLSRQRDTRPLCLNMNLQRCAAFPPLQPLGSPTSCHVHGEVQLILHYEENPATPPPRAIGSSKSACFLCDLFIKKYGRFGLSHSHMKLYPKWTVPNDSWMDRQQQHRFRDMVRAMSSEIASLLKEKSYHHNDFMESRAHMLLIERNSDLASSIGSPPSSHIVCISNPLVVVESTSTTVQDTASGRSTPVSSTVYYAEDLPIEEEIQASTKLLTLLIGKVDYIFDFEDVGFGRLSISNDVSQPQTLRVNARDPALNSSVTLRDDTDERLLTFHVHDDSRHELRIAIRWTDSKIDETV
ncbi:hypothetical protein BDZ45DRAFT_303714 [Acephala macrosclerotiorum]|nr:hypothetical protein BDZ45DRAFT_303714 [Acephala macrosclerotiorum]